MELVTATDLLVTASLALLLSFLVAKLVSFAMTAETKHVNDEPVSLQQLRHESGDRLTVQTAQRASKVEFLSPIQVAANVETERHREEEIATVELDAVVELQLTSESNIAAEVEVEPSDVAEKPITEPNEEIKVLDSHAVDSDNLDDSAEQRNTDSVVEARDVALDHRDDDNNDNHVDVDDDRDNPVDVDVDGGDDDDDWEGIERSELERVFMAATEFVKGNGNEGDEALASVGSDVQMELYGLHKVATEGPCREPQPMPLRLSARAKWNTWQKLGNMSPEVAMEKYIGLLSDKVPGWEKVNFAGKSEYQPARSELSESAAPELSTSLSHQQMIVTERDLEHESGAQDRSPVRELDLESNVQK